MVDLKYDGPGGEDTGTPVSGRCGGDFRLTQKSLRKIEKHANAIQKLSRTSRIGTPRPADADQWMRSECRHPSNHYFLLRGSGPDLNKLLRALAFISFRDEELAF